MSALGNFQIPLHELGWKAFQDLAGTIFRTVMGPSYQTFNVSKDGGRDGAFEGTWNTRADFWMSGTFTIQCKFFSGANRILQKSDLADELTKAKKLAQEGRAQNYLVFTNASVTGDTEKEIGKMFCEIPGIRNCKTFAGEWICQTIAENPKLRMLVPRIYGLGDLSQILDTRAYEQAKELLSLLGNDLAKYVPTQAFRDSAHALIEHGFVLLLGAPAAGKSSIAAALAAGALDNWKCLTLKISYPADLKRHWNPNEKQFFWVDDAFGVTQYDRSLATTWNQILPELNGILKSGSKILLTSRDYIYRVASYDLKTGAFPLLANAQVIVNVEDLSVDEKEQILYNHVKLGSQSQFFRRQVKPYLPKVASNRNFLPEIARRLGDPTFTQRLKITEEELCKFVEEPEAFLREILHNLDGPSKAAIGLVFMRGGRLDSPVSITEEEISALGMFGATPASIRLALSTLDGSLISNSLMEYLCLTHTWMQSPRLGLLLDCFNVACFPKIHEFDLSKKYSRF
jgi:hypothetical protein